MGLVQITKRSGEILRVKRGETPALELHLGPNESVVSVELEKSALSHTNAGLDRKTVDWQWTAYVASALPPSF